MLPLVGKNYCLRLPDGRPLGHVWITWTEDSWAGGPFAPTAAFEGLRPLFQREAELRKDQIIPLWEEAAEAIENLHVQAIEEGTSDIQSGLRVRAEGDDIVLGAPVSIESAGVL
jgi:hypothetical protein